MQTFVAPLRELAEVQEIEEKLMKGTGIIALSGCIEAQKANMIYGLSYDAMRMRSRSADANVPMEECVIVTENELTAKVLQENLSFYLPDVLIYPAKDLLFYQADLASNLLDVQRMRVFRALLERERPVIIAPVSALMDPVTERSEMAAAVLELASDTEEDLERLRRQLVKLGYERCAEVSQQGQFASRGDILDIWALTEDLPFRFEFFGDEIESIRRFDPESQRSVEEVSEVNIYPANDSTGKTKPFINWFDGRKVFFVLDEPGRLAEAAKATEQEFRESVKNRVESGSYQKGDRIPAIQGTNELIARLNRRRCLAVSALGIRQGSWQITDTFGTNVQGTGTYNSNVELLIGDLERYRRLGYRVVVLSASPSRAKRLAANLQDQEIPAIYTEDRDLEIKPGQVVVEHGHATRGFEYPLIKMAVISETDIFGKRQVKKKKKRPVNGETITSFSDLHIGDCVVHETHGIGIYKGIEQVKVDDVFKDYIKIEYKNGNLYVLATQLDMLQKYSGGTDKAHPPLSRLGGKEWDKTRAKAKASAKNIAGQLVRLYAAREMGKGFIFSEDTEWQKEFEEFFPFEETDDQLTAIGEVKADMESGKIMDRLICGDVGYGKTEIALRAAFKAVQDGKQVAYLVPTTILAQQHYNTFLQRMKDFPVRTDLMCRFRTPSQIKKTVEDLKRGYVDIVIGTHRLLSKDVQFRNLGLLIIDEEQRFGVTHKEKIKEMRKDVDVLTLTATPIPRTLHMSLAGIRDMSILSEPPLDRTPIQTYVMEYNEEMVREAICRELARNGQVYYVYNRVTDIADLTERIRQLIPEANVAYAHGQMKERELESIMVDFINGEIDVLISTTIIETGLDISNANTMIIHDADRMGLSQLYQLRGRVGRSSRTAYCFLMYKRDKLLSEVAEKRLSAIREFTELGSGIRIAMRDLEIRGSGNLLGSEQSGQMDAIGYDLYCKILRQAVKEVKGEETEEEFETVVDLSMDAFIPDTYIPNEFQKLEFYKKIAGIMNEQDYEDISDELMDRYGPLPAPVKNLLRIANLKASAHRASITEIKERGGALTIRVLDMPTFDTAQLPKIIGSMAGAITIHSSPKGTYFLYHGPMTPVEMTNKLKTFADALASTVKKE